MGDGTGNDRKQVMSYGHAESLLVSPEDTTREKLVKCVMSLHQWAVLNPGLMPLYNRFKDAVDEMPEDREW